MNLFDLLANFWRIDEQKNFTGNETRLYFFLIHLANRSFGPNGLNLQTNEWLQMPMFLYKC